MVRRRRVRPVTPDVAVSLLLASVGFVPLALHPLAVQAATVLNRTHPTRGRHVVPSTPHTAADRAKAQTKYTAAVAAATALRAASVNTAAAAEAATAFDLQLAVRTEAAAPLI